MLSYEALVNKVVKHRRSKGLPVDDVAEDVMFQLCLAAAPGSCVKGDGTAYVPPQFNFQTLTPRMVMRASETILKHYVDGRKLCSVEEAQQRVATCFKCRLHVPFFRCRCGKLRKQVEKIIKADRRNLFRPEPGACASCGCSVLAKANLPKAKILESNKDMEYWFPNYCWQNE